MTNLQRIQSMTKEELATFLAHLKGESLVGASATVYYGMFGVNENTPVEKEKRALMEWLDEEMEEEK